MIDNDTNTLTACLLVYNHAHLIESVIKNILEQTYSNFQLLICDDRSTDNSYEILKPYEKVDKRVKVIRTPHNLGMAGNTNYCFSKINSKYIALLHHDDVLEKSLFQSWVMMAEKSDNISFVFNDYLVDNRRGHFEENRQFNEVMFGKLFLKKVLLRSWGCPVRGTALIRKRYFEEIGGMDENFGILADVDLWMRLSARWDVGYVNKQLITVRQERPHDYPKEYTDFSWKRFFILFNIHASNINRNNYPNNFSYLVKKFVFRNKVSFEIIKWHLYALIKRKTYIINAYPNEGINLELFYSIIFRSIIKKLFMRNF